MRHHTNCNDWGYDTHPDRAIGLAGRCQRVQAAIRRRCGLFNRFEFDTRAAHLWLFKGMTPASCACILGHYRGYAGCPVLRDLTVGVSDDPTVGLPPLFVDAAMTAMDEQCKALLFAHNYWLKNKGANQPTQNALLKYVNILAVVLEKFLTIHPYMDGNGHMARLLIYTMMVRAGYPPSNWNMDAKQPYAQALSDHRRGKRGALQVFLLGVI